MVQLSAKAPGCNLTAVSLAHAAMDLMRRNYQFDRPLRALGVRACDLMCMDSGLQLSLDGDIQRQARWEQIESCVDIL